MSHACALGDRLADGDVGRADEDTSGRPQDDWVDALFSTARANFLRRRESRGVSALTCRGNEGGVDLGSLPSAADSGSLPAGDVSRSIPASGVLGSLPVNAIPARSSVLSKESLETTQQAVSEREEIRLESNCATPHEAVTTAATAPMTSPANSETPTASSTDPPAIAGLKAAQKLMHEMRSQVLEVEDLRTQMQELQKAFQLTSKELDSIKQDVQAVHLQMSASSGQNVRQHLSINSQSSAATMSARPRALLASVSVTSPARSYSVSTPRASSEPPAKESPSVQLDDGMPTLSPEHLAIKDWLRKELDVRFAAMVAKADAHLAAIADRIAIQPESKGPDGLGRTFLSAKADPEGPSVVHVTPEEWISARSFVLKSSIRHDISGNELVTAQGQPFPDAAWGNVVNTKTLPVPRTKPPASVQAKVLSQVVTSAPCMPTTSPSSARAMPHAELTSARAAVVSALHDPPCLPPAAAKQRALSAGPLARGSSATVDGLSGTWSNVGAAPHARAAVSTRARPGAPDVRERLRLLEVRREKLRDIHSPRRQTLDLGTQNSHPPASVGAAVPLA